MPKLAVVLFNLGGPDSLQSVRPFLFNLFNDRAIIGVPGPLRWLLAEWISRHRAPVARRIYECMGGGSPLLQGTETQARALQRCLGETGTDDEVIRVFVSMRYWHPLSDATVAEVKAFGPDEIVLLPLYPQFSTTTTQSSFDDWQRAAAAARLAAPTFAPCCYPRDGGLVAAQAKLVRAAIERAHPTDMPRVLFSAHGLPEKIIGGGDPYAWQVEQTARAIVTALAIADLDWAICYQSRVGRRRWIEPSIDDELRRAGAERMPVVVVPIAFVSEHSETLVELDIEYAELARDLGIPGYVRVAALGIEEAFIHGLAALVRAARTGEAGMCGRQEGRLCPETFGRCPYGRPL